MDKVTLFYLHNGILFSHQENKVLSIAGKWMRLEMIMVMGSSQTQKDKEHIFCHLRAIDSIETETNTSK